MSEHSDVSSITLGVEICLVAVCQSEQVAGTEILHPFASPGLGDRTEQNVVSKAGNWTCARIAPSPIKSCTTQCIMTYNAATLGPRLLHIIALMPCSPA
eukprot:4142115-Amphidinium_carterae.1